VTKVRIAAAHGRDSLYFSMGRPSPTSKLSLVVLMGDLDIPSSTWFLRPSRIHNPKGISIGSAVFATFTIVTDRQTDRQTSLLRESVTIGCIYVRTPCLKNVPPMVCNDFDTREQILIFSVEMLPIK